MTLITPVDGQPALAEHVAQLTETLTGVRAEPLTLAATLTARLVTPAAAGTYDLGATANRWRKLWAVDGEFTNAPTAGGVALSLSTHSHPQTTTGEYNFQVNPAMTDPGNGNFRSNTGVTSTATALAMDQLGAGGTDVTALFNAMRQGDTIFVQDKNDATKWVRYQITALPTINAGWAQVPVSVISSGGAIAGASLCVMQLTLTAGGGGAGVAYVDEAGDTMTGLLTLQGGSSTANVFQSKLLADTQPRYRQDTAGLIEWGPGGSTAPDTTLARTAANDLRTNASLIPTTNNARDLGLTGTRWRKLWAVDAEFTNAPTVGGVALPTAAALAAYLPLAGGTVSGTLITQGANGGAVTLQSTVAGEANPRIQVWAYGELAFGPGNAPPDTGLTRRGAAEFGVNASLTPFNDDMFYLGQSSNRWSKLWAKDANFSGRVDPAVTNTSDLGALSLRWKSAYLGTVLSIAGASATANQITTAITTDAQPRLIVDGNGRMRWGPGGSTAQDTTFERTGAGVLTTPGDLAAQHLVSQGADAGFFLKDRNTANQYIFTSVNDQLNWYSAAAGVNQFQMKDGNVAIGPSLTPVSYNGSHRTLQVGQSSMLIAESSGMLTVLAANSYYDGTNQRTVIAGFASRLFLNTGKFTVQNAPNVGAGASHTMATRIDMGINGQVAFTPDAGVAAIVIGSTAQPKISVQSGAPSSPMTGDLWVW